jgi:hypothetical protein
MSFTAKELREVMHLPSVSHYSDLSLIKSHLDLAGAGNVDRAKRRLTDILLNTPTPELQQKSLTIHFMKSPTRFIHEVSAKEKSRLTGVVLAKNEFITSSSSTPLLSSALPLPTTSLAFSPINLADARIKQIEPVEEQVIETGLVVRSIGYVAERVSQDVPFDELLCRVPNLLGRVITVCV